MTTLRVWLARLAGLFRRSARDRALDDEIRAHIADLADDLAERGMSRADAATEARRQFGGVDRIKASYRDQRGWRPLEELLQDVRYSVRTLRRAPLFAAVAVLTLTLGVAANAVMVGVVDQMLLRPPAGIGRADSVRRVYFHTDDQQRVTGPVAVRAFNYHSYPVVAAIRNNVAAFDVSAATYRTDVSVGGGADVQSAHVELTNADYFRVLGLRPAAGRFFTADEDRVPDADPVVVLSHRFWMRELGGSPQVLGSQLLVEGALLTIVGIAPQGFSGIDRQPVDFWVPIGTLGRLLLGPQWESDYGRFAFGIVARLSADATDEIANTQATAAYRASLEAADQSPWMQDPHASAFAVPLSGLHAPTGIAAEGRVGLWLLGVSVVVLLIAGANVVQLLLTRTLTRRREITMRLALGASRGRLVRQLLTESTILAALAATTALAVTYLGGRLVQQLLLPGFAWDERVIDVRMLVVALGVGVLLALVTGLAPAIFGLSNSHRDGLRPARVTTGRTGALRGGLLVVQTAFSVVLLVGAGLFAKSLYAVRTHDVGVDLERVLEATLPGRPGGISAADAETLYTSSLQRLAVIPGVERVAMTYRMTPVAIRVEGATEDRHERAVPMMTVVTPDYFATIGASIEYGRDLTRDDDRLAVRVAVVNRALAAEYWSGGDPLG